MPERVVDYRPRSYFVPYHERAQRFACIVAHRGAGKTTATINELQKGAVTCRSPRPRFAYIAPLLKQAKTVAWDTLKHAAEGLKGYVQIHEGETRVDYLHNKAQVRLFGADNPDALRGIHYDGVVIDEPAQQDPRLWEEIINPAISQRGGWVTFIGTPKGRDAFYKVWRVAESDRGTWYASRLPLSKTKILGAAEVERSRNSMSAQQYAREFECSFDEADVSQFIDGGTVEIARKRIGEKTGPRLIGVDVARHGDDRTVIICRDGSYIDPDDGITVLRGADTMQTAARVVEVADRFKPWATLIDGVGVGGGVVDRLRQLGLANVIEVNAGARPDQSDRYYNQRMEMWARMKDWLLTRGALPDRDDLADDLAAPLFEYDAQNRMRLEKKEDMKARSLPSPDLADALALTFARTFPVSAQVAAWEQKEVEVDSPLAGF